MIYKTDILPAFQGVSQLLHTLGGWNGLIEDVVDYSLLWRQLCNIERNGDPDRKQQADDDSDLCLPTYSCCAWLGSITYTPQYFELRSLVQRFEVMRRTGKRRRLVRFF